ncbi:MAG: hypothetical protein ABI649_07765 [Gaiellaceae bacterium]
MRSNRRRNWIIKRLALGLAVAAFAAPAAQAKLDDGQSAKQGANVTAGAYGMPRAMPSDYAAARGDKIELVRSQPRTVGSDHIEFVRVQSRSVGQPEIVAAPGFDWSDAGIGAGLAFGLLLLGGGAVLATRPSGRTQTA